MTTQTIAAPGAAEIAPEAVNPESTAPENTTTDAAAPQTDATAETGDDADKSIKRLQRRVDRVTAARYQAEARAQQLEQELSRYRTAQQVEREPQQAPSADDIERHVQQRAAEMAAVQQVSERSNAVFNAGVKAFGQGFGESVALVIEEAGPLIAPNGRATPLGEALLDADKPAALLHHLAQNPDIAEQLRGLSAAQLGRRVARIEADMAAKVAEPKRSSAPKPIESTRGTSSAGAVDPTDVRRWIEAENARQAGRK